MKTVSITINIPFKLNEDIKRAVAKIREKGNHATKETVIVNLLTKKRKELL